MIKEEKIDLVIKRFTNRFSSYNTKVLETIGKAIKQFDGIRPTEAHILAQKLKYGEDINNLLKELENITKISQKEIEELFNEIAKNDLEFAEVYYKARNLEYVDYENNEILKRYVKSISDATNGTFINISKTTGFTLNKNFNTIRQTYIKVIDEAVNAVATGQQDFQSAMYNTIKQLASSGVKKVDYASGYSRRLDSSVAQMINDGIANVFDGVQNQIGKEIGADGVEITAHLDCAIDHLENQGRQYTKEEFDDIQAGLSRPFESWNCRHRVYQVILGVNEPSYSNKELEQITKSNLQTREYDDKSYTKYEATQMQRRIETEIRKQKDFQILGRSSGNYKAIMKSQNRITKLTNEYKKFSNAMNIPTQMQRMRVSGYHRIKV